MYFIIKFFKTEKGISSVTSITILRHAANGRLHVSIYAYIPLQFF